MSSTNEPGARPRSAYGALAALFAINVLNYIDRDILAAVIEPVQKSLGIQNQDTLGGLLSTAFFISLAIVSPLMGWMGDHMRRTWLLAVGMGVASLATAGSGMARSVGQMVLARSVLGVGEAAFIVIAPTLVADLFGRQQRSQTLGVFYAASPIGSALGYVIGGRMAARFAWPWAFYAVGAPGLAVGLAALAIPEPRRGASETVDQDHPQHDQASAVSGPMDPALARNRSYVCNTLGMAMVTFAAAGLSYWVPKFLSTARGLGLKQADTRWALVTVTSGLVGTVAGGWLGDRLSQTWRNAYFWLCGGSMLASVPFLIGGLGAGRPAVVLGGLGIGLMWVFMTIGPSNAIISNVTMPQVRAVAFAINLMCLHLLGDIPSPTAIGWVSDLTGSLAWGLAIVIPALVAGGVLFCLGARYLQADQDAVLRQLGSDGA